MKTFKTLGLMCVVASGSLVEAADYSHFMHVNVPFAFEVSGQHFTAGQYDIRETSTGVIMLQGEGKAIAVISTPSALPKYGAPSALRFSNTPQRDLQTVAMEGEVSRQLPVHEKERKLTFASR
jgi:hypothetical protein